MDSARCARCRIVKPLDEFRRNRAQANGRCSYCRACEPAVQKQYSRVAQRRAYRSKYPEKQRAVAAVNSRVQRGTLTRQPCEVCGADKVHAHHDDYSKPLNVRWLCPKHHMALHAELRRHREAA